MHGDSLNKNSSGTFHGDLGRSEAKPCLDAYVLMVLLWWETDHYRELRGAYLQPQGASPLWGYTMLPDNSPKLKAMQERS